MTTTNDVLAQIDAALGDRSVSPDAMRHTPNLPPPANAVRIIRLPAPVPVVRMPDISFVRSYLVRRLIEDRGLDPDAARHAVLAAERGEHTEYTAVLHAEARAVVAQTKNTAARVMADFLRAMRPALDALAKATEQAAKAFEAADYARKAAIAPRDRPAWQSPYGPPRRPGR